MPPTWPSLETLGIVQATADAIMSQRAEIGFRFASELAQRCSGVEPLSTLEAAILASDLLRASIELVDRSAASVRIIALPRSPFPHSLSVRDVEDALIAALAIVPELSFKPMVENAWRSVLRAVLRTD